jgi:hypothetical protein
MIETALYCIIMGMGVHVGTAFWAGVGRILRRAWYHLFWWWTTRNNPPEYRDPEGAALWDYIRKHDPQQAQKVLAELHARRSK